MVPTIFGCNVEAESSFIIRDCDESIRRTPFKSPYAVRMAKPNREDAVAVAVPIRSFSGGKERLSSTLSVGKRSALARRMSDNLLRAVQSFHVVVVTNDAEVQDWADACGAHVLSPEVTGLNAAAEAAHAWADAHNKTQLVIVHSDGYQLQVQLRKTLVSTPSSRSRFRCPSSQHSTAGCSPSRIRTRS